MESAARLSGQIWGPGFLAAGSQVDFEASAYGLRLVVAEEFDGSPPWHDIIARKGGFNDRHLMLEWQGRAGRYTLAVSDPASIEAARKQLNATTGKTAVKGGRQMGLDRRTRAWSHGALWVTFVLPVMLLAAMLWEHDRIVGWAVSLVPVEQERKLGAMVFTQAKAKLRLVEGPGANLVRALGARLTRGSPFTYEFDLVEDASVNAFAMPGGFVVVHTGLLALADNAEQVAGVLAHEIQHVEQRHSLKAMAKSLGLAVSVRMVLGDLGGLTSVGSDLLGLKFSRENEAQADREGLKALVVAGISPAGMRDFFRKLGEKEALSPGWLSSHPASEDRFTALDAAIKSLPPAAAKVKPLDYDYDAIKAALPASATPATRPAPGSRPEPNTTSERKNE